MMLRFCKLNHNDVLSIKEKCQQNFCLHGGSCGIFDKIARCSCKNGFGGEHCDIGIKIFIPVFLFASNK